MTQPTPDAGKHLGKPIVFVANAQGFIESHLVSALLRAGFAVRASCETRGRAQVDERIRAHAGSTEHLTLVSPGLHPASEWKRALGDSRYAIQSQWAVSRALPGPALLAPEEQLAMEALRQASRSKSVQCIDIAPSGRTIRAQHDSDHATGGHHRSRPVRDLMSPVLAAPHLRLHVPCPMGPVLHAQVPGSMQVIKRLLDGGVRRVTRLGYEVIDVRGVTSWMVDRLASAQLVPGTATLEGTFIWMAQIATLLRRRFPQFAQQFPRQQASDFYVLRHALFNAEARQILGALGRGPRPAAPGQQQTHAHGQVADVSQTLIDAARSIIFHGRKRSAAAPRASDRVVCGQHG
jgi:dihydroflavonol-4-reductase